MYASSFAIRSPSVSFSETWSILSKIFLKIFLVFSKNNAGTKKQLAQNEEFQMADITRGTPFFHSEQRGKCDPVQPSNG
jgi:hypothetical protein